METIFVNEYALTGSTIPDKWANFVDTVIGPKLGSYNNITYLGMATNTSRTNDREAVFQLKDSSNVFLRLVNEGNNNATQQKFTFRLSNTGSLTTTNSYINVGQQVSSTNFSFTNDIISLYIWLVSDANNNLITLWQFKPTYSILTESYPLLFVKTGTDRDVIIYPRTAAYQPIVVYLDDSSNFQYYLTNDVTSVNILNKILRINCIQISSTGDLAYTVDAINDPMCKIYSTDLNSVFNSQTSTYSSSHVRRLIKANNTYYRQVIVNYWIMDPKGNEEVTEITTPTGT